jgi:pyruvate/2-oxoglutarate dehydrogenase complex dihydrolipoamide dehydrogenase (E3) component
MEFTVSTQAFDLITIGGGSGGLACAQRAAEYGARAAVIESHRLGGTCVNVGCVPKKVMWNAAGVALSLADAGDYGFDVDVRANDWGLLKEKRDAYITRLNGIYARNLSAKGVTLARGPARFVDSHTVEARRTDSLRSNTGPKRWPSSAVVTSHVNWPELSMNSEAGSSCSSAKTMC